MVATMKAPAHEPREIHLHAVKHGATAVKVGVTAGTAARTETHSPPDLPRHPALPSARGAGIFYSQTGHLAPARRGSPQKGLSTAYNDGEFSPAPVSS